MTHPMLNQLLKIFKKYWFYMLFFIIVIRIIAIKAATYIVYKLAPYTDSMAGWNYIGKSYDFELIHYNEALKEAMYLLYAATFIILILVMHIFLRKTKNQFNYKLIVFFIFLLGFPTFTNWQISIPCNRVDLFGFGCSKSIPIITPVIMANNPFYILISLAIALFLVKIYINYFNLFKK